MTTRAPSADGANLGHHAEPTLGEDLCAGTVGVGGAISARWMSRTRFGRWLWNGTVARSSGMS